MDRVIELLLGLSDPTVSLDLSLERVIDSREQDYEKDRVIDGALQVGAALLEAARRSARKHAFKLNASSWILPHDITVKVFSMLDTQSLCYAAAVCSMFNKCAMDPSCYSNIDLIVSAPKINNAVVSTMIQRAGKHLRSLKLGIHPCRTISSETSRPAPFSARYSDYVSSPSWNEIRHRLGRDSSGLTRSCLLALGADGGVAGALLRRLHLHNIDKMDTFALSMVLSTCQFLLDLELIGLHVLLKETLDSVSSHCHLLERLFFESHETGIGGSLRTQTCEALVNGCPNLMSLALRGFKIHDRRMRILLKGLVNLKIVNLAASFSVTGAFLRNLGNERSSSTLEVLILRDCLHLKVVEVTHFLSSVLAGDHKNLRYLDLSNKNGLSSEKDWNIRCFDPSIPVALLLKERPNLCLLAHFPSDRSNFLDFEYLSCGETNSGSGGGRMIENSESGSTSSGSSSEGNFYSDYSNPDAALDELFAASYGNYPNAYM